MKLILLGTGGGGGVVRPHRHLTSLTVIVGGEPLLFDCGEGATRQLVRAGFDPRDVTHLFFTHHHYDHNTDYPFFVLTSWHLGRDVPLRVFGPEGTKAFTDRLFGENGVFQQDLAARTQLAGSQRLMRARAGRPMGMPELDVTEVLASETVVDAGGWRVSACFTEHVEPIMRTLAYRVDSEKTSIAVVGDSAPTRDVIELAKGADILVHECSATQGFIDAMGLGEHHSGPAAAGRVATEAGVDKLVINHILNDSDNDEDLRQIERRIEQVFSGEAIIGEDLMTIEL